MNDKKEPSRGLEKVYHFFLTGNAPSDLLSETPAINGIKDEKHMDSKTNINMHGVEYDRLEHTVAQLYVLRDSCKGMHYTQNPDTNPIWFQGAAAILKDAIMNLMKTLQHIDNNPSSFQKKIR